MKMNAQEAKVLSIYGNEIRSKGMYEDHDMRPQGHTNSAQ